MAERRLRKELNELYKQQPRNCCAWPVTGDLMLWEAAILGVRDTPYYLGVFSLRLKFNSNYPFVAPRVHFLTKIYHCNIDFDGYICWDLLSTKWTALINVSTILHAVCALMREPNTDDPCDEMMAALYRDNRTAYFNNAIDWTLRYAIAPSMKLPPLQLPCKSLMLDQQDEHGHDHGQSEPSDGDTSQEELTDESVFII
ncbi:ubiquitin-conjugating enzyme E2 4-like [Drosophila hydei]|uniref:Ubiquitin-conjugating enzyme E2 4-like n=1 Tax=Drosophila hydei TaxID=7224 RepID=A0A6J1M0N1_DROHY|nr:ubiquitin-conjugating enzyme E2 4-like [Drosophila hydei]